MALNPVSVVLLAGGNSTRMGQDKASMLVAGRRLIDHVLEDLAGQRRRGTVSEVVVVAPPELTVPDWVHQTMEEPAGGGPVAGVFAGLAELGLADGDWVVVLTCDAPHSARLVPMLSELTPRSSCLVSTTSGRLQYLLAGYRVGALRKALGELRPDGSAQGLAMRTLVARLRVGRVQAPTELTLDLDDPADVARWELLFGRPHPDGFRFGGRHRPTGR